MQHASLGMVGPESIPWDQAVLHLKTALCDIVTLPSALSLKAGVLLWEHAGFSSTRLSVLHTEGTLIISRPQPLHIVRVQGKHGCLSLDLLLCLPLLS